MLKCLSINPTFTDIKIKSMKILQLENRVCVNMILHTFHAVLMGSCSLEWLCSEWISSRKMYLLFSFLS